MRRTATSPRHHTGPLAGIAAGGWYLHRPGKVAACGPIWLAYGAALNEGR